METGIADCCNTADDPEAHVTQEVDIGSDTESGMSSAEFCPKEDVSPVMYSVIDCRTPLLQSCDSDSAYLGMVLPEEGKLNRLDYGKPHGDEPHSHGCISHDTSEETGVGSSRSTQSDDIYFQDNIPHSEVMTSSGSSCSGHYFDGYRVASHSVQSTPVTDDRCHY